MGKQRLELTWIGKNKKPKLEPRILIQDTEKSFSDPDTVNMLIHGDNLLGLKALEQEYSGKVKCIYIDPPYNTGQAFEHYEDGLEHSIWLTLMKERFLILRNLLTVDGVFFCQLNDDEMAYGKVLLDEVFGRTNFLNQVSVRMKQTAGASGGGEDKKLKKNIEYILIYVKNNSSEQGFKKFNDLYENIDLFELIDEMESEGKSWKYTSIIEGWGDFVEERTIYDGGGDPIKVKKYKGIKRTTINSILRRKPDYTREQVYVDYFQSIFSDTNAQTSIRTRIIDEFRELQPDEVLISSYIPKSGREKGNLVEHYYISPTIRRVIWLKDSAEKKGRFLYKREKLGTLWQGFPLNNLTKEGGVRFPNGKKPEALIKTILELATNPGDLVLDSFLGSGTTAAVAHKMGRRWIGIELGDHCYTHCKVRLDKVVSGEDQGGISKSVNWKGGGGYKFYELAPSLLNKDDYGNWVINKQYNPDMLAAAMAKQEGFKFNPDPDVYWKQGQSTEQDFIFTTTEFFTQEHLEHIQSQMQAGESLLICCKAFNADDSQYSNITIKKIPQMLMGKCEFGKDDYSLNIINLPSDDTDAFPFAEETPKYVAGQGELFNMEGGNE